MFMVYVDAMTVNLEEEWKDDIVAVKRVGQTKRKDPATYFSVNPTGWRDPGKIVQCHVELQDNNTGFFS